jgi:hypothetical protein
VEKLRTPLPPVNTDLGIFSTVTVHTPSELPGRLAVASDPISGSCWRGRHWQPCDERRDNCGIFLLSRGFFCILFIVNLGIFFYVDFIMQFIFILIVAKAPN